MKRFLAFLATGVLFAGLSSSARAQFSFQSILLGSTPTITLAGPGSGSAGTFTFPPFPATGPAPMILTSTTGQVIDGALTLGFNGSQNAVPGEIHILDGVNPGDSTEFLWSGGNFYIQFGNTSSSPGTLNIAGQPGTSSAGGAVSIIGGAGASASTNGGAVSLAGGGSGNGTGGAASVTGGSTGTGTGGAASLVGGNSTADAGGEAEVIGGAGGNNGSSGVGGETLLSGGSGGSAGLEGSNGGVLVIQGGNGGSGSTGPNGNGGSITIQGGYPGSGNGAVGSTGSVSIQTTAGSTSIGNTNGTSIVGKSWNVTDGPTSTITATHFNGDATTAQSVDHTLSDGTHITGGSFNGSAAITIGTDATNANTASTIVARDGSGNFSAGTITATLNGDATTAQSVDHTLSDGTHITGGSFNGSANVTIGTDATNSNTVSTIVARDGSGNFSAGTITAALNGDATTAQSVDHTLSDGTHITGGSFNGSAAITIGTDATNLNTASTIVARDGSGNFSAGTITAALSGNATTANSVNNSLSDGTHITGGSFNGSAAITIGTDATNANTASTIVARDGSGNFSAGTITATLTGTASNASALENDTWAAPGAIGSGTASTGAFTQLAAGQAISGSDVFDVTGVTNINTSGSAVTTIGNVGTGGNVIIDAETCAPTPGTITLNAGTISIQDGCIAAGTGVSINNSGHGPTTLGNTVAATTINGQSWSVTDGSSSSTISATHFDGTLSGNATTANSVNNSLSDGTHITGGSFNGSAAITIGTDATNLNTASTIVARDGSGNFSAGTITAALTGTASNASALENDTWASPGTIGSTALNTGAFSTLGVGGVVGTPDLSIDASGNLSTSGTITSGNGTIPGSLVINDGSGGSGNSVTVNNAGGSSGTYQLPTAATGTLALTSDLSSYLPLAGGTMSGPLVSQNSTGDAITITKPSGNDITGDNWSVSNTGAASFSSTSSTPALTLANTMGEDLQGDGWTVSNTGAGTFNGGLTLGLGGSVSPTLGTIAFYDGTSDGYVGTLEPQTMTSSPTTWYLPAAGGVIATSGNVILSQLTAQTPADFNISDAQSGAVATIANTGSGAAISASDGGTGTGQGIYVSLTNASNNSSAIHTISHSTGANISAANTGSGSVIDATDANAGTGSGLSIELGNPLNASSAISISNGGSGNDITGNQSYWSVSSAGAGTFTSVTTAPTANGATSAIVKQTSGTHTSGDIFDVTNSGNTTTYLGVDHSGAVNLETGASTGSVTVGNASSGGMLVNTGVQYHAISTTAAPYTALASDYYIIAKTGCTGVNYPATPLGPGQVIIISNEAATNFTGGASSFAVPQAMTVSFIYDGTNWNTIN